MARIGPSAGRRSSVLSRWAARMAAGIDARVVPEAIGGLGGGPIAGSQRYASLRLGEKIVDQFDQAFIQSLVSEVDVAKFEC